MFKSSLATHSSIDHDLFPLLTVRSCVSEADESKNGPRFCAEDKMTGGAYEIRSRKLDLETEQRVSGAGCHRDNQNLSQNDLWAIKRQQDRINALLTATAHCAVPPCVTLPIDVYIQEQPSTGNTYVASVDAFSGLSLGDIIRSGWGVMEERVFLEILNAVEAFGYASASLPPHGNLSSDAIKQLLIVRDGASEARQPSRWVVSDWLLLSDDSVTSFDPQAFVADLEWVLHSSFAQLSISTTTAQGSALMPAARVEELVGETVDRIRAHLLQQDTGAQSSFSADGLTQLPGTGAQPDTKAVPAPAGVFFSEVANNNGVSTMQPSLRNGVGVARSFDTGCDKSAKWTFNTTEGGLESPATAAASMPSESRRECRSPGVTAIDCDTIAATANNAAVPTLSTSLTASLVNSMDQSSCRAASKRDSANDAYGAARQMSLKDKVTYHQAALRNEQLVVNKHRRKNAPLPPRPQPVLSQRRNVRQNLSPRAFADDAEVYYDPPTLTSPIAVKPSAYLMQSRRPLASGRGAGSARKLQSPHNARTPNSETQTPREPSRSTATSPHSQQPLATSESSPCHDQVRERLLDDVVTIAVLNQYRRTQDHRLRLEGERRRREQRQQILSLSTLHPGAVAQELAAPTPLEEPCTSVTNLPAPASPCAVRREAVNTENRRRVAPRSNTAQSSSAANPNHGSSAAPSRCCPVLAVATNGAAMSRVGTVSESPEPRPPSPRSYRMFHPIFCQKKPVVKAAAGTWAIPQREPGRGAATTAVVSRAAQTAVKPTTPSRTVLYGIRPDTLVRAERPTTVQTAVNARSARAREEVAVAATVGRGSNASRQPASGVDPRPGRSSAAAENGATGAVRQQQLSARKKGTAPLAQRRTGAATTSSLVSPRAKIAEQSAATPFVKPLSLAAVLGRTAFSPAGQTTTSARGPPHAPRLDARQQVSARRTATSFGMLPGLSGCSPQRSISGAKFEVPRSANTARPPPAQQHHGISPWVYRRVSSTGALHSPRNGVVITPCGQSATATLVTAPPSSSPIRERPCSARQTATQPEAASPTGLHTMEPRLRNAANVSPAKGVASVNRTSMQRLEPKVWPKRWTGHARTLNIQKTDLPLTTANKESLTSPCTPPLSAATAGDAAMTAARRDTFKGATAQCSRTEVETRTSRGRDTGGSSTSTGARPTAASQKGMQKKQSNACGPVLHAGPLTLGRVRPVNEASPGILLRRNRRSPM
uniref:Uncharacterized protein n=1 Tax=Leishmania guyanensis TaxID=5670 RepID=A0A1E1J273_LEIGU|nr:hypothetical protein, conserved [Leishmania guyanensis]